MNKRMFATLAVLMITSMLLAACGGGGGAAAYECTDPLGCVDVAPGEPIHIAYALVIAGPDETLGVDSRNGIEVAMALKGQILGHDVKLSGEDDGCSAEGGQAAGTKLAADPTIVAVIGTSCSSAAADVCSRQLCGHFAFQYGSRSDPGRQREPTRRLLPHRAQRLGARQGCG